MVRGLICLLVLAVCGCTGVQRDTQPPEVRLSELVLTSAGLLEQRWQLTLRVHNPNDHTLSVRSLAYKVYIEEQQFAQGTNTETIVLPPLGETQVTTRLTTHLLQNFANISGVFQRQDGASVPYRVEGKALLGSMPVPVGFSWSGQWPDKPAP